MGTSRLHETHLCSRSKEHCLVIQRKTIQKGTKGKYHLLLTFSFLSFTLSKSPLLIREVKSFGNGNYPCSHADIRAHTHTHTHTHTHKVGCSLVKLKGSKLSVMGLTTPFIYLFKFPGRKDQKSLSDSKWCATSLSPYTHNCNCLTSIPSEAAKFS